MSEVKKHFDQIARRYDHYKARNKFYYTQLKSLLNDLIKDGSNILEIGCGTGDLLACLNPKRGLGQDISSKMIKLATKKHPTKKIIFTSTDLKSLRKRNFDYIFMSDVIEHLEDIEDTFSQIYRLMTPKTVFVCTMANPLWEPALMLAEKLGLKMPEGKHYRRTFSEIKILLKNTNLQVIAHDHRLLFPVRIPFLTEFVNKYLEPSLRPFAFIEFFICKRNINNV